MSERLYEVKKRSDEDELGYIYEIVENGPYKGVRCRRKVKFSELFNPLYKWIETKYGNHFLNMISKRYDIKDEYKFEAFSWLWPYDTFDETIGINKAKDRVDEKIKEKKNKIKKFIKNLEKNNISKKYGK